MNVKQLRELTAQLLKYNQRALANFQLCRQSGESGDFFNEVKPFADKVKEICEEWQPLATQWALTHKPKHIYPIQISNTVENLQMVSIRAFFPKTSLRQFNSHIQSIEYVLNQIWEQLQENNSPCQ